jgi:glutaconate CoA-transferase subunit A
MATLKEGRGPLFMSPDVEEARGFFRTKSRAMTNKVMTVKEAVSRFVKDGDYFASGGFGTNRIATAVLHEMLRQGVQDLGVAGHTTTHDFEILAAGNQMGRGTLMARLDVAYIIGLEARGLSPHARRVIESGEVELCEWTNYALALRFLAAAMGVPYLPARNILGSDTFERSGAKEVICPFTGIKLVAYPALYPDVAAIHVHEADEFGNCRIKGITIADRDLASASKKVIITTERLISNDEIRSEPAQTTIPFYCVDAVCVVPHGSYPGNMPFEYFSDEAHLREWLAVEKDLDKFGKFLERNIYGVSDFGEYVAMHGGAEKIAQLRAQELFLNPGGPSDG